MLIPHLLDCTDDPEPCVKVNVEWRLVTNVRGRSIYLTMFVPWQVKDGKPPKVMAIPEKSIFLVHQYTHSNFIRSKCESLLGTFIASTLDLQVVLASSYLRRPFRTKSALWKPNHQVKAASCWLQFWFEGVIFMGISGYPPPQCHPGSMAIPMTFSADPLKDWLSKPWVGLYTSTDIYLAKFENKFASASFKINNWIYTLKMINTSFVEVQHALSQDEDFF